MELSVVIPIYHTAKNACASLPGVIHELRRCYTSFEILFIIDNDRIDDDIAGLFQLQASYPEVHVRQLKRNYGQHFATLCGYYLAKGNHILSIDEDMSKYITETCRTRDYQHYDVFFWFYDKNTMYTSDIRKAFSILFKLLIDKIVNFKKNSTFRMISRELRDRLLLPKHIFWNLDIMIFDLTDKVGGTHIEQFDVKDEGSGYSYQKLARVAFEIPYEHNTIFMNLLLALVPALLCLLISRQLLHAAIIYMISFALIQSVILYLKTSTPQTESKIREALLPD